MRKITIGTIILLLSLLLVSCFREVETINNLQEVNTENSWQLSYDLFHGAKAHVIEVAKGEQYQVVVNITTHSGELAVSIVNERGNQTTLGTSMSVSSIELLLDQEGTYEIKLTGKKHVGTFDISWEKLIP